MNPSFFYLKRKAVVPIVLEPELQAAIDRIALNGWNTYPTNVLKALNTWITQTKSNGNAWMNNVIRVPALNNTTLLNASLINLKDPNGELATVHGGVTYTVNGFNFNGVNSYVDHKFNPTTFGLTNASLGVTHDLLNDFAPNGIGLFGAQQGGRRIAFFPRKSTRPNNIIETSVYANDTMAESFEKIALNRTISYGRNEDIKFRQINNTREVNVLPPSTLLNVSYFSGAMNNNGTAIYFCNGTERIAMIGKPMTEAKVNQQMTINNTFYAALGLPLNS